MSISVIIPTLNAEAGLPACFDCLAKGAIDGVIREVIIADGGSGDATIALSQAVGAVIVDHEQGRGSQMIAGANVARGDWLLFLHADTVLSEGWIDDVRRFITQGPERVGVFGLQFDEKGIAPAIVAGGAMVRTHLFKAPYGDQGLLISRSTYDKVGGYRDMALFEDVDIVRRLRVMLGRNMVTVFNSKAITSATRYRREGYTSRVARNFICILMYKVGRSPQDIVDFYRGKKSKKIRQSADFRSQPR